LDTVTFKGFDETIGLSDLTNINAAKVDIIRNTDNSSYGFTA
jgi:hypothetical protein